MNGLPGALSAYFLEAVGIPGLLTMAAGLTDRRATVTTALGYADAAGVHVVSGTVHGTLTTQPRGRNGHSFDTVFAHTGSARTFAEMSGEQKDENSPPPTGNRRPPHTPRLDVVPLLSEPVGDRCLAWRPEPQFSLGIGVDGNDVGPDSLAHLVGVVIVDVERIDEATAGKPEVHNDSPPEDGLHRPLHETADEGLPRVAGGATVIARGHEVTRDRG